jgi:hypothetical protein
MIELNWLVRLRFQRDIAERNRQTELNNGAQVLHDVKEKKDDKSNHPDRDINPGNN